MKKFSFSLTFVALAVLLAGMLPAHAAAIVAVPGSFQAGYATQAAAASTSAPLQFVNTDLQPHDVVARKTGGSGAWCSRFPSGKCPAFASDVITVGGVSEVKGINKLAGGGASYEFYCSVHPTMEGTLVLA